jgi:hypothetical protein
VPGARQPGHSQGAASMSPCSVCVWTCAGSLILVTTEVEQLEGRKVWMCARVTDGGSTEYARARALFVSPRQVTGAGG